MTWLLESSNYFVEFHKNGFDSNVKRPEEDLDREFEDFSEALQFFFSLKESLKRDNLVFLFKNEYKLLNHEFYKKGKILGTISGLDIKSPNRVFMEFRQIPASPTTQCWQLLPLKNKEEAEKCEGEVWEVPLYWDTRLNKDFSQDFNFATIVNYDAQEHHTASVFWNPGLNKKDKESLKSLLDDRILSEFDGYYSFYDSGDHYHQTQVLAYKLVNHE